jgi:hypothetical protein
LDVYRTVITSRLTRGVRNLWEFLHMNILKITLFFSCFTNYCILKTGSSFSMALYIWLNSEQYWLSVSGSWS